MDDAHGCASVALGMDAVSDRIYSVSQMLTLGLHPINIFTLSLLHEILWLCSGRRLRRRLQPRF